MADDLERLTAALADRYAVQRELGRGGMATVYLARDLKHNRLVAVKVLRPELSAILGADRFLHEIEVTANLQHPNILPLYDSGEADTLLYYVMPYIEGETLRGRLSREKQLSVEDAVEIAKGVAAALAYAHSHGVIHRDIKPENILLESGQAVVADFGIALAVSTAGGHRLTESGLSLGTPQYMSPEQATGDRDIDARSDVYALGAVVYEMLVGDPPHTGSTVQAIIAKILSETPSPVRLTRELVPRNVEAAVHRALAKTPADRFATAAQFVEALSDPSFSISPILSPDTVTRRTGRRTMVAVGAALGLLALGAAAGWFAGRDSQSPETNLPSRLSMLAPNLGGLGAAMVHRQIALTPDGSAVLFVGAIAAGGAVGGGTVNVQRIDEVAPRSIPGTEDMHAPKVSPNGEWLAVQNDLYEVMRVPMRGGVQNAAPLAPGEANYAWHPDGSLWVTRSPYRAMERLSPDGDSLEVMLADLDRPAALEQILDNGRTALVVERPFGTASGPAALMDLRTGERTLLIETLVVSVRYTAGYLVYAQADGTLLAQPFDPIRLRRTGAVTTVAIDVSVPGGRSAQFEVAPNGTVIYIPDEPPSLVFVDRAGAERLATDAHHGFHMPRFSPDGRRLSVDFASSEGRDTWILDLEQETLSRATFDRDGHDATWTPDGQAITYTSQRTGANTIFRVRPLSGAPAESLFTSRDLAFTGEWLRDGSRLVTVATDNNQDIVAVGDGGRGPITSIVSTRFRETHPAPSPDGRWLAFVSDQSGRTEVYVMPLDGEGDQIQVSQGGGDEPAWGPDGGELFYRRSAEADVQLEVATVVTTPGFRVTGRQKLFSTAAYAPASPHRNYDVSPDGQYFVMVRRNPGTRIVVIQNLPALVQRLHGSGQEEGR